LVQSEALLVDLRAVTQYNQLKSARYTHTWTNSKCILFFEVK